MSWKIILFAGVLSLLGGVLSLVNPAATSLSIELLIGWTFIIASIINLIGLVNHREKSDIWSFLLSLVMLGIGFIFVRNPLGGVIFLSSFIMVTLFGSGLIKIMMAIDRRNTSSFWPLLVSGAISLVAIVIILTNYTDYAEQLIGIIFAIELITNGIAFIAASMALKQNQPILITS